MILDSTLFGYSNKVVDSSVVQYMEDPDTGIRAVLPGRFPVENVRTPTLFDPFVFPYRLYPSMYNCIEVEFSTLEPIQIVSLLKTNLSRTATVKVCLYAGGVLETCKTVQAYDTSTAGYGTQPWGSFNWGGVDEFIVNLDVNKHTFVLFDNMVMADKIVIQILDSSVGDSIVVSGVWAGPIYQPETKHAYDSSIQLEDLATSSESDSGVKFFSRKILRKTATLKYPLSGYREIMYKMLPLLNRVSGFSQSFIMIMEPTDPSTYLTESVYGVAISDPYTHASWMSMSATISMEESL